MSTLLMDKLSVYSNETNDNNKNLIDSIDNTIKLQLKKPNIWNWELSTSKSSPNIAFPKIQLYNDKGDLLAETNESENVFNNYQQQQQQQINNNNTFTTNSNNSSSNDKKSSRKNSSSASSTSVKIKDKRRRSSYADIPEINEELNDFINYIKNENFNYKFNNHNQRYTINNNNSKSITNLYEYDNYYNDGKSLEYPEPDQNYNEENIRYRVSNNNNKTNRNLLNRSLSNKLENFSNNKLNDYDDDDNNIDDGKNLNVNKNNIQEEPIWIYSAKGLIQRDMNSKEFDHLRKRYGKSKSVNLEKLIEEENLIDLKNNFIKNSDNKLIMKEVRFDLKKSKSTTDILSGKDKKKCRRTNSNTTTPSKFSKSILERMSASKMGTSTESQDIKITQINHGPRYFLRTSKAGTLVVCEDNYNNRKTRRRPKSIPRILRNDENDEFHCDNKNNDIQFYDNAINKLDHLIKNASLKDTINSENLLKVNNLILPKDMYRGKSVEIGSKNKKELNINRKFKDIRRCVSAGNVCLSSDEDKDQPKKEIKLRRKRKIQPVKSSKGDQILALNNTNLSSSFKNVTPRKIINEKDSDELLLHFVKNLSSLNENQNELQEKNNFINNNIIYENDSILKENDENINFEVIKCESNDNLNYDILNNNNNNNNIDNENYYYPTSIIENTENLLTNRKELIELKKNMGSNISRNSSKQQEPYHQSRRRTHSSGDIHNNKHNNSSFYNLLSNNPNDKLSTIPGYDRHKITNRGINGDKKNKISHDDVDTTINHYIQEKNQHVYLQQNHNHQHHHQQQQQQQQQQQHPSSKIIKNPNCGVTRKDRNKFRGSLPNHLDTDIFVNEDNIVEYGIKNPLINFNNRNTSNQQQKTDFVEYVTVTPNKQQIQQHQQNQENNSPYNNNHHHHHNHNSNVSEKEAASTSSGCGRGVDCDDISGSRNGSNASSNLKFNQDKPDIQLTLPLARAIFDPSCDQGYGSERSPEDELPQSSILKNLVAEYQQQNWNNNRLNDENQYEYNFITEDCTFSVEIVKGPRGLGLSISGGIDTNTAFPGLIRIKRLFPHQAAWSTGKLQQGDIILDANGISLTGLTNYEALEVLRTMPNDVILLICRPVDEQYKKLSPPTEPPKPPQRTQQQQQQQQSTSIQTQTLPEDLTILYPVNQLDGPVINHANFIGEFEIFMVKEQGSLGFTLRKEDDSVLGHYVRALVREPATSDGRIKPGDKIVAVNDIPLSPMTHEQAVIFLRQSGDFVKLRLYRDKVQTPIEPVSPTTSEKKSSFGSGKKVILRPEAINLLTDLAHKKQNSLGDSTESSNISSGSSPRRLKRGHKSQSSQSEYSDSKSSSNPAYLVSSQSTLLCSDSDQSIDSQCSYIVQPADINESDSSGRNNRPQFLNLGGNDPDNSGNAPAAVIKKPNYQFAGCTNTFELNNLDNDALDAPIFNNAPCNDENRLSNNLPPEANDFASLPCEALLNSVKKLSNDIKNESMNNISHKKNPLYQSVHVQQQIVNQQQQEEQENIETDDETKTNESQENENDSFIKWKDVILPTTNENDKENSTPAYNNLSATTTAGENSYNQENKDKSLLVPNENSSKITEGYKMLSVELNRGWNSRLGFSLQPDPNSSSRSVISAIYGDSVAARDGRLRAGDILVSVNDESVKNMSTSDIIDFLRIIRGAILITVLRKDS